MARGPLSEETKRQRALENAMKWLQDSGVPEESVAEINTEAPAETVLDKIREAQSVLFWFATKGYGFKEKICKGCGGTFAYKWNVDSIAYCSIHCASEALRQIGIKWDPYKDQSERWGRYAPAVVPPHALNLLKNQLNGSPEDLHYDIAQ